MLRIATAGLSWIGRHGTAALVVCIFLGMAVPALSKHLHPFLGVFVFGLLTLGFLRVDGAAIGARVRRPRLLIAALLWMMLIVPGLAAAGIAMIGLDRIGEDLALALFISTAAPPVMAAPAFLYLLGLNGTLSLALTVAAVIVTPVTAPLLGELMLGPDLPLSVAGLAGQLALLLAAALATAYLVRRLAGPERVDRNADLISGANVLVLLIFAIAAMDGVAASVMACPVFTLTLTALTFCLAFAQIGLSLIVFAPASRQDAYAIAHTCGTRNMGLLVAAFGGTLPELTWLWFAVGQFPIYTMPMIAKPFVNLYCRLNAQHVTQKS